MKKRRYVLYAVLLLLIAIAAYLGFRFYPVWKAAEYLHENMDMVHYSYELEVELDREKQQESQGKLFEILTGLTGFEEDALYHLTVKGTVWGNTVHALVYPQGAESPFIELYLENDTGVVNETLIYNAIRNHLVGEYPLLGLVVPEQEETLYMTLEQVGQLFGLDLSRTRNFNLRAIEGNATASQYFAMLATMSREKGEGLDRFTLDTEQLTLQFEIPKQVGASSAAFRLCIKEPAELAEEYAMILSRMGLSMPGEQFSMVKSYSVTMAPGGEEIFMPTDFVNQNVVELISKIREWVMKLKRGEDEESSIL